MRPFVAAPDKHKTICGYTLTPNPNSFMVVESGELKLATSLVPNMIASAGFPVNANSG